MKIFAVVSYKGSNYQGWQKQPDALTIQEVIETNLSKIFNRQITIYGAGRTDTGVHALGQTFHFEIEEEKYDLDRLLYSINSMLPPDIAIISFKEVDKEFHSRFDAKEKVYRYVITLASKDVFHYQDTYVCPYDLDINKMRECLTYFKGRHNFKNFTSKEEDKDNFERDIYDIEMISDDRNISITFRGNGFMRYMIRFIVGTAIEVARNKVELSDVKKVLDETEKRNIVSWKAPASGLVLVKVNY